MSSKVVALQAWCKHQCQGYRDVEITNMTTSWRSGLAFCAIIHRYHPELIDYDSLDKDNVYENNKLAFDVAATLGISPFLDPEDMVALKVPDRLSILTYISQYYNTFGNQKPRQSSQLAISVKRPADESLDIKSDGVKKKRDISIINYNKRSNRTYASSEDTCHICKTKVYLIERYFDDNHLFHHSCFRNLRTQLESSKMLVDESQITNSPPMNEITTAPSTTPSSAPSTKTEAIKPSTTEAIKPSITEITKPSTTEAIKLSTTEITKPSTTEITKSTTTEATKSSTAEATKPPATELTNHSTKTEATKSWEIEVTIPSTTETSSLHLTTAKPSIAVKSEATLKGSETEMASTHVTTPRSLVTATTIIPLATVTTSKAFVVDHQSSENKIVKTVKYLNLMAKNDDNNKDVIPKIKEIITKFKNTGTTKVNEDNCTRIDDVPSPALAILHKNPSNMNFSVSKDADMNSNEHPVDQTVTISSITTGNSNNNIATSTNIIYTSINDNIIFTSTNDNIITNNNSNSRNITNNIPPKLSYSDSLLSLAKQQQVKIAEVVRKNYEQETLKNKNNHERENVKNNNNIEAELSSVLDMNSNNKWLDGMQSRLSSRTISSAISNSSGSNCTIKMAGDGIDRWAEGGDSNRPKVSILRGESNLNTNYKGKSTHFQDPPRIFKTTTASMSSDEKHTINESSSEFETKSHSRPTNCLDTLQHTALMTRTTMTSKLTSTSVGVITPIKDRFPNRTCPQVPPRTLSVYKFDDLSHLEGLNSENGTKKNPVKLKHLAENDDILFTEKSDVICHAPIPKPRNAKPGLRHSIGGQIGDEMFLFEITPEKDQNISPVNLLPRHQSFNIHKKSKSPPPRPPPPMSHKGSSSSSLTSLPSVLKISCPSGRDIKTTHISPNKAAPVKPPRLNVVESSTREKSIITDLWKIPFPRIPRNKGYKPHQVVCSTTVPTDTHPLAKPPNQAPPRPSEPPSRKKILPQSQFYFESISFEDPDPIFPPATCKTDIEKNEIHRKLKLIDEKLKKIESKGRIMEQVIRSDKGESTSDDKMATWFHIIIDRNELVREEADLLYRCRQLDLEKEQANIEAQLRTLMMIADKERTLSQKRNEDQLIKRLLEIVGKRSSIVDSQENDRIRYLKEDESLRKTRESLGEKNK